jgi:hypothetical protein
MDALDAAKVIFKRANFAAADGADIVNNLCQLVVIIAQKPALVAAGRRLPDPKVTAPFGQHQTRLAAGGLSYRYFSADVMNEFHKSISNF